MSIRRIRANPVMCTVFGISRVTGGGRSSRPTSQEVSRWHVLELVSDGAVLGDDEESKWCADGSRRGLGSDLGGVALADVPGL